MKKILLSLFSFTICSLSFSQSIAFADGNATYGRENSFITIDADTSYDVEGSKYLTDSYQLASISTMPDNLFKVKYNIFSGEMEVESQNNKAYALNKYRKDIVITFINTKTSFKLFDYIDDDGNKRTSYFSILKSSGDNTILKKQIIIFQEEKFSKTGYDEHKPPQFKRLKDRTYIKVKDNMAVLMPKNKSKFAALFPESKDDILKFIKKNKIKLSKDSDLVTLIEHINTL
ncbi:hypothetical protein [Pontimicrobium sp. IMCC45349]|uniref:hypothetical protein n=1 Tax=Pontimicrobium sp. IMCC45349 TaxID=3391574 RepID=UPI0039A18FC8